MTENLYPEKFSFSIGSYTCTRTYLEWNGCELNYISYTSVAGDYEQDVRVITPSESDWRKFWGSVRTIGVWHWRKTYDEICVCDGIEWELELKTNNEAIKSNGAGSFAPNGDSSPSEAFKQLLRALGELINDQKFIDEWYYESWD